MYKILACDDEKDIVSALRIYLTSDGYQVFEAYSNNGQDLENRSYTGFLRLDEILRYVSWKFDNSSGKTQAWENRICSINCRERGEIWQNGRFLFAGDGKLRNL